MHHRSRVFLFALLLASFGFVGCSGLVAGDNGNPPPPSTLVITNVQSGPVTTSSSQVVWTTNVPANSSVDYGTTTAYGNSTPVDSGMVTSHQMTLSGLAAGTTYYYQVNSTDSKGNHGHGGNKFNTTGFSLSGAINPATGGSGSTLTLSGWASSTTATADSVGNYTFAGLANGTYTVAPKHAGFTFTPSSQSITVNGANITGVNFTDTAQTFSISGTISPSAGGSGATVTLGGAASVATTANSSGAYTATGLASGSYTITPSNTGYTFTPVSQNTTVSTGDVTGVNFTAYAAPVAPTITTQPASQTVTAGQNASFSVAATGTAPLSYQWNKNGTAISGATSSSYTTPATTSSDNGAQFTVMISNTAGSVTSSAGTLTVSAAAVAPSITTEPANQTVTAGQTASFSVAATGTTPLNYQWNKNGTAVTGATSSSYTTPATTSSDNGAQFTVVISNTAGSVTSNSATLTVNAAPVAPSITTQPTSQTVTAGQTASFSVTATGTPTLSYQWKKNGSAISGATSSSYTTPATASSDNGALFTVVISNTAGSVTSSAAILTVNAAPVAPSITTQPASQTVTMGQAASFSVAATGTAPLSYQWQKNSVAISGATSSGYTTLATSSSDNGAQFTVVISNTAGSVTSGAATLTVNAAPVAPSITTQPASQTVTAGQTASFSVAATGTAPLSYQWQKNSVAISGATSSSYTTPATTSSDNGAQFTVVISNTAGSVTSNPATLTVNAAQIAVVPTSVSFGNVVTGTTNTQSIKLTNSGTASLTLSQAPVSGNGFSISGLTLPLTLSPGQSTNFNAAFAPAGAGSASGSVSVVGNASNSPLAIPLSGAGVAATFLLGANPATLGFGTVNVGSNSQLGATLTNSGNSNVTISSVTVTGTGFSANGVSGGATLTPNQSVTLNVAFAPTGAGSLIGSVTVASNATNSPAIIALSGTGVATTIINVKNYGATGNGSTDDTAAIDNAIAALQPGYELYFPCGTYLVSSQLASITKNNVTIDGQLGCSTGPVTIKNTGSTDNLLIGDTSVPHTGYINLNAPVAELSNTFTGNFSSIGLAPGDYISISQGGVGGNTSGGPQNSTATQCDVAGCQGEMLKVASVNGNTATVTTAFHDTYDPANIVPGGASASNIGLGITKFTNIIAGINIHDLAFDGSGSSHTSILAFGLADLTVNNISAQNFTGHGIYPQFNFNTSWTNINLSVDGCDDFGIDFFGGGHNTVNGLTSSGGNGAWCGGSGGSNGLGVKQTADSTFSNILVDKAGTSGGRPMKLDGARYNTFNNLTVKNGPSAFNGVSVEYYSSHNTFNSPVIQGNQSCNGCGGAGVMMFGNYNQYNTFNTPTITGNGNLQFYQYGVQQLTDSHTTISGGTIGAGVNTGGNPAIGLSGDSPYVHGVMISGPAGPGIGMSSPTANSCINNNTFGAGTGLGSAISSNGSTNTGLGNILNGLNSNLTAGTCGPSGVTVSVSPTTAAVTSGGAQQFTATVTGSSNTAVTWTATAGSISSSGLFTAPTASTNMSVTVAATSQADTSQTASATVKVTLPAPPNTFGYAVQGASVGSTMSNSVLATRYQMAGQNGMVTSMSVFIASPISASPNNQFQVAIYADNNGTPGALLASSASQTIVPDAWNTVLINAPVTANTYYWLAYDTNGLAANTNNLRYDVGGATSTWITSEPFGTWPATYGPIAGTNSSSASMYATY